MTAYLTKSHATQSLLVSKRLKKLSHFMRQWLGGNRWLATRFLKQHNATRRADILLATGYSVHKRLNPYIIEKFQGTKILVMRDIIKSESEAAFARLHGLFDRIYSFDPEQCARFHLDFLPQCIPFGQTALIRLRARTPSPHIHKPCALYVGRADQRYAILSVMAEYLRAQGCEPDFFVVNTEGAKAGQPWCVADYIPYIDYIERALRAKVIVEANLPGQSGITLRTLEAAFLNKKLLTNNLFVRQLDFYDPNNIFILGQDDPDKLDCFLHSNTVPIDLNRLLPHTPEAMLEKIMADCGL
jgi:1,5-rhamnosyltransferase